MERIREHLRKTVRYRPSALADAREAAGLTQPELASILGVSRQRISEYEREGGKTPRFETAARLAVALGIPVETLVR